MRVGSIGGGHAGVHRQSVKGARYRSIAQVKKTHWSHENFPTQTGSRGRDQGRTLMAVQSDDRSRGRVFAGTSGFAYPAWAPRFYATGTRAEGLLPAYALRLRACELNNTFYQQPTEARIGAWVAATPPEFRFVVKAQRGGSVRALHGDAEETLRWLTAPYGFFGERLGCVLFRVPAPVTRDDAALGRLLSAWPAVLPLSVEFQHPSWYDDDVHQLLTEHGATLCATDLDEAAPPDLRVTGRFLYLRLRRTEYEQAELRAWAARLAPFLNDGLDVYVFFRHDEDGASALRAEAFATLCGEAVGEG